MGTEIQVSADFDIQKKYLKEHLGGKQFLVALYEFDVSFLIDLGMISFVQICVCAYGHPLLFARFKTAQRLAANVFSDLYKNSYNFSYNSLSYN